MYGDERGNLKGWIPFIVLIVILGGVLGFVFFGEDFGSKDNFRKPIQPSAGCVVMYESGDTNDKIDIVFLPDNYEDIYAFRQETEELMESFFNTIPYDTNKDKFNFFRIEEFGLDLNCNYRYGGDAIVCNPVSIKRAANICPYDYPIVVVNSEGLQKFYELLRSSSWMGTSSLNSADDPLVFPHEFAHAAWDFADEYVYGGTINWDAPNCDSEWKTCPKFSAVQEAECVNGCVNNLHSRSIETGIMRDFWKSDRYGAYNEHVILRGISENTNAAEGDAPLQSPIPIYSAKLIFDDKGEVEIVEVIEMEGFPDGKNTGFDTSKSISVVGEDGESLYEVGLPSSRLYLDGRDEDGNPIQEVEEKMGAEYVVNLPRTEKDEEIVVKERSFVSYRQKVNVKSKSIWDANSQTVEIQRIYSSS